MKFKIVLVISGQQYPYREDKRYCSKRSADKDLKKIEAHAPYILNASFINLSVEKE